MWSIIKFFYNKFGCTKKNLLKFWVKLVTSGLSFRHSANWAIYICPHCWQSPYIVNIYVGRWQSIKAIQPVTARVRSQVYGTTWELAAEGSLWGHVNFLFKMLTTRETDWVNVFFFKCTGHYIGNHCKYINLLVINGELLIVWNIVRNWSLWSNLVFEKEVIFST